MRGVRRRGSARGVKSGSAGATPEAMEEYGPMDDAADPGDRRLEVTRGRDGRIVLASMGGGMPVIIRMTRDEAQAVIVALAAEVEEERP